jgi:hypothetical protein
MHDRLDAAHLVSRSDGVVYPAVVPDTVSPRSNDRDDDGPVAPPLFQETNMADDQNHDQPTTDTAEELEEHREDWDPMMPETTVPDPASDYPEPEGAPSPEPEADTST